MNVVDLFKEKQKISRLFFQHEYSWISNNVLVALFTASIASLTFSLGIYLRHKTGNIANFIGAVIVFFMFVFVFLFFVIRARKKIRISAEQAQSDRNRFALEVVGSRGLDTETGFCLFLRPFLLDGAIKTETKIYAEDVFTGIVNNTVENSLTQAIDLKYPVVALGGEPVTFGPGGAAVKDEDWVDLILDLMDVAQLIVVVPFAQPSTLWEIKQIHMRGFLHKTVFFVPPLSAKSQSDMMRNRGIDLAQLYDSSIERFKKDGIPMPRMGPTGGLYWLHGQRDGGPLWRYRTFRQSHHLSYKAIRKIILEVRNSPLTEKESFSANLEALPFVVR
jgi:hypothetical protein